MGCFYGEDQTKRKPQQCGLALAPCRSDECRAGKTRFVPRTARCVGSWGWATDGQEHREQGTRVIQPQTDPFRCPGSLSAFSPLTGYAQRAN